MGNNEKEKTAAKDSSKSLDDDEDQALCEKAFAPETARSVAEDEPCKDGAG
jgi:hypothetical protein